MYPESNESAKIYDTTKTDKFDSADNIKLTKTLCDSEYTIKDNYLAKLIITKLIKELPPLKEDAADVSYGIESLFTNIPINDTIGYILDQIYVQHRLKPTCSRLIFKRLLIKLSTEVTFTFNNKFCKQSDCCTRAGPLLVTLSDIYMTKLEKDAVCPFNPQYFIVRR